ncbi:MAG: NUDIX hydrolase [Nitrososphaerota archaeon]
MVERSFSREYPPWPLPAVGVLILDRSRILLIKRAFQPSAGRWSIPGGVVELGEKVEEAAKREVREEVGIEVYDLELLGIYDSITRDSDGNVRYHYVIIDFLARPTSIAVTPSSEVAEYKWVDFENIDELDVSPSLVQLIKLHRERIIRYCQDKKNL